MERTAPHTPLPLGWFGGGAGWGCLGSSGNSLSPTNRQARNDAALAVAALCFQTPFSDFKGNPQMSSPAASPPSDLLNDVALAWASLQRARHVLQRMESELVTPSWQRVSSQSCRSLDGGQEKLVSWKDWNSSNPVHAKLRVPHFPENCNLAATSISPWLFQESVTFREEPDGSVVTSGGQVTHLDPVTPGPVRKEQDFNNQLEPERKCTANDWPSTLPVFVPFPSEDLHQSSSSLSSGPWRERSPQLLDSPADFQKWPLTGVKRSFPDSRLEQLREKIRAQKHRLQARSCAPQALPWKHMPKRNVYKMKLGASSPIHPSQVSASSPDPCDAHHAVSHKFTPKRKNYRVKFARSTPVDPCQRDKIRVAQSCRGSARSPSPRRLLKGHDAKLTDVSAWRKGQKLVRLLLGPPPTFLQLQNRALLGGPVITKESGLTEKTHKSEHIPPPTPDINNQKGAPLHENFQISPETSAPVDYASSEPFQAILNLLKNLQSHIQDKADNKRTQSQSPKGTSTKKAGESKWHSSRPQNTALSRRNLQFVSDRENFSSRMGSSGAWKVSGKENVCQGTHRKTDRSAPRPYTTAEIREFMHQKAIERKRRCLEARISVRKALELREKKLQEVYKKQREAFSRKTNARISQMPSKTIAFAQQFHLSKAQEAKESQKEAALDEKQELGTVLGNKELQDRTSHDTKTPVTTSASENGVSPLLPVSMNISPGPLKQQYLNPTLPPALNLQSNQVENLAKTQVSVAPSKESSPMPFERNQARIRILEATAQVLKERIEFLTEKLNLPEMTGTPSDKSEKCMDVQSSATSPAQECPPEVAQSSCALTLGKTSSLTALRSPGGPEAEMTSGREKGMTQESGKDGEEMETKVPAVLFSPAAPDEPRPKDLTLTEDSEMEKRALKDKKFTCPPGFFIRSPQKESEKQDNFLDSSGIQMEEELTEFSLGTPESYKIQEFPTRRTEFLSPSSRHIGCENCNKYFKDACISYLSNMQQKSLGFLQRMKLHQIKQERELEILKQRAELEAEETQKSLDELVFRNHLKQFLHDSHIPRAELDNKVGKWKMPKTYGSLESIACLTRLSSMGRTYSNRANSPTVPTWESEPRRNLLDSTDADRGRGKQDSITSVRSTTWSPSVAGYPSGKLFSREDLMDSSQRNEISQSNLFDRFSLRMTDQYLREEELRTQYQAALLKLREKALQEKVTTELSWLEQQKSCLGNKRDHSLMTEKQHRILMDLKQDQVELKHLQNMYEVTHQERKLLLTQQKDILTIQQSTAHLEQEFPDLASRHQFSSPWSEVKEGQKSEAERALRSERLVRSSECLLSSTSSPTGRSASILPDPGENLKCCENTHLLAEREIRGIPDEDSCLQPQWLKGGKDTSVVSNMPDRREQTLGLFVKNDDQENKEPAERYCTIWRHRWQESSLEIKQDPCQKPRAEEYNSKTELEPNVMKKRPQSKARRGSLARGKRCVQAPKNELNPSKLERSLTGQKEGQSSQQEDSVIYNKKNQEASGLGSDVIKSPIVEPQEQKRRQQRMKDKFREVQLETVQICHISAIPECKKDQEKKSEYTQYDENHLHKCDTTPFDSLKSGSALSTSLEALSSSTISSCNSLPDLESGQSYLSFSEFQKVTAILVNVSDSLISGSDLEAEGSQNTDVNEWQEFTDQQPVIEFSSPLPNPSVTPSKGDGLILRVNSDEKQPDNGFSFENCQDLQKTQGNNNISTNDCPSETNLSLSGSWKQKLSLSWTELPLSQDIPSQKLNDMISADTYVALKEDKEKTCSEHEVCVEPMFSSLDDFSETDKDLEEQSPAFFLGKEKDQKDFEVKDILLDGTSKKETEFSLPEIYFMPFPSPNLPLSLPFEMSQRRQNLSVKKANPVCEENPEGLISNKVSKFAFQQLSDDFNNVPAKPGPRIFHDEKIVQSRYEHEADESDIHQRISEGQKVVISPSGSPKGLVPEAEHCPTVRVDGSMHNKRDGVPTLHGGILSEILSPIDEVLSYGSAGLPSPTQKGSSFPSEDFPSPPPDLVLWANGNDTDFNSEDFPSLPEEVVFPESSKNAQEEGSSIQTGELSSLSDEILPEEFSPVRLDLGDSYSVLDEHSLGWDGRRERSLEKKEELLNLEPQQDVKRKQKVSCWSSPTLSRSASKSPALFLKTFKSEDGKNPLAMNDAGNREEVTHTQREHLKFKETSHFEGKHWTNMEHDKAKDDHKKDLERVKHSEYDMYYDELLRSDQMSYLLADCTEKSREHSNQDSVHYEPSLRSSKCYDEIRAEYRFLEKKPETKFNNNDSSITPVTNHPVTLTFQPTEMESCFIHAQSESEKLLNKDFSACLNSQKEQLHKAPIKNEAKKLLEDVDPMVEKKINFKNSVMGSQLDPRQKTYGIVDSVSTELTKKILWDVLAVFAELAREQNISLSISRCVTPTGEGELTMKTKSLTVPSPITASTDHTYASDMEKGEMTVDEARIK
ncbi:coiled-coil domain-containing protein 187 isoform X3 [Notamacropus eugenii]|uniref:coiled-coil domain-containing protein 187 isoform X3 n=1 Tax=Notamacropus eugenii TaxID=9315 RepID=UPI003B67A280